MSKRHAVAPPRVAVAPKQVVPPTYVATVTWRAVEVEHFQSVIALLARGQIVYQIKSGDALIERGRAIVATSFLLNYPQCDVMIQLDSDVMFKPEDVHLLAQQCRETKGVVCGLYTTRSRTQPFPAAFLEQDIPVDTSKPEPVPIRWPATGFMAVHRSVLEKLAADLPLCHPGENIQHYPFFNVEIDKDDRGTWINLSEDYSFGKRVRDAGFSIYCSPSIRLRHIGTYAYRLEDMADMPRPDEPRLVLTREGLSTGTRSGYHIQGAAFEVEIEGL